MVDLTEQVQGRHVHHGFKLSQGGKERSLPVTHAVLDADDCDSFSEFLRHDRLSTLVHPSPSPRSFSLTAATDSHDDERG